MGTVGIKPDPSIRVLLSDSTTNDVCQEYRMLNWPADFTARAALAEIGTVIRADGNNPVRLTLGKMVSGKICG